MRVTERGYEPGAATRFHRHEMGNLIVALAEGRLRLVDGSGVQNEVESKRGQSYFRRTGVEHDAVSASEGPFAFVETELKPR